METKPTAIVYVDGLNLYKRLLEGSPEYKWLDIYKMAEILLPTHEIVTVHYFTSRIKPPINDPQAPNRQDAYIRALQANCNKVTVTFGRMTSKDRLFPKSPIVIDEDGRPVLVKVRMTEEKGSDVALASRMVMDAAAGRADMFVLVSSDSDFAPTLELLTSELRVKIGLLSPSPKPSRSLVLANHQLVKIIRNSILSDSQMSESVGVSGAFVKRPIPWIKNGTP